MVSPPMGAPQRHGAAPECLCTAYGGPLSQGDKQFASVLLEERAANVDECIADDAQAYPAPHALAAFVVAAAAVQTVASPVCADPAFATGPTAALA
jgi:hypothetical protein